jgi:transcriptional accessory protein Tex/SPT6
MFCKQSRSTLLATIGRKRILAIDPGFRSGCKIVCLDEKAIYYTTKPLSHQPQNERNGDVKKICLMVNALKPFLSETEPQVAKPNSLHQEIVLINQSKF